MIALQISSTNSKGRTNLLSVINSSAFIWVITLKDFIHKLKSKRHILTQKFSFSKEQKSVKEQQQFLKIPSSSFDFEFSV